MARAPRRPVNAPICADPRSQAELISETLDKLRQVQQMLVTMPQVLPGEREQMLNQLSSTSEQLRTLAFLDVIY